MKVEAPAGAGSLVSMRRFGDEDVFDPWEELATPDLPLHVLPASVREFVDAKALVIGGDPNALAMSALVTLGAALDHRFALKMMRHGSWWASPRLWLLLCGDPSRKKTPVLNAATRELEELQAEAYEQWEVACAEHKASGGAENDAPSRPPRYVTGDPTVEKLGEILGRQDRGLLVKRDELSGWLGSMEKYSGKGAGAADRGFWLQAYDGGRFTIDRIARGEKLIRNLSVSLIGGIQPGRLAEMKDQTTDGLLQRFVPIMLKPSRFPVDEPSKTVEDSFGRLVRRLAAAQPEKLILDDVLAMERLRRHIFEVEQVSGGLASGFQAFAGKLPGVAGSLALILHIASDPESGPRTRVGGEVIERVDCIMRDFVIPHGVEFYRSRESLAGGDRLRRLGSWLLTCGKPRIVVSDLTTNVAMLRGMGISDVLEQISPFVAVGWLKPDGSDPVARAWTIEPKVRAFLADRARIEEKNKATLARLMNSPRRGVAS